MSVEKEKLILLHGALGSSKQFDSIKLKLSDSFEVFTMNFEGHGDRHTDREYAIDLFAQNLIDVMEENSIASAKVLGYSMGGYVALYSSLQYPSRFEKIITLGTKFNWSREAAEKEVKMLDPEKIEEKVPAFANQLKAIHHAQDWKSVVRKTAKMMLAMGDGARISDEAFQKIQPNVVIGLGSQDRMVTYEESARIAETIPDCKLIVLKDQKHPIEMVDGEVLYNYLIENL